MRARPVASRAPRVSLAQTIAAQVLLDHGVDDLPVDPFAIAAACNILVEAKPPQHDGFSGMLVRVGESYGILYATYVDSPGFQRFSVAHELGHYFMPDHMERMIHEGPHPSRAGFATADPFEIEADLFAAALLMPSAPFQRVMARHADGLDAVIALADRCETSLTATAVSYVRHTRSAVAVVQCTGGVVDFCMASEAMKSVPLRLLRKGEAAPNPTATSSLAAVPSRVAAAARDGGVGRLSDWFERAPAHPVREDVIGLGRFGRTLTVLHCDRISLEADGYEDDDDEEATLIESWTPRFRR